MHLDLRTLIFLLFSVSRAGASKRPHIIIFLMDDLGWYDVGFHDKDSKSTPFVNQLAKEGVHLNRHYAFTVCSPSRSALMSGRLPIHVNVDNPDPTPEAVGGVDVRMTMLPKKLKAAGYKTAMVGKWHLGARQWGQMPTNRGFDEFFGYLGGEMDYFTQTRTHPGGIVVKDLWRNDKPAINETGQYSCEMFAAEVVKTINDHDRSVPLFYYISMQTVHGPIACKDEYMDKKIGNKDRRTMMGMMKCADIATQNVTKALKAKGMWDNTFMLWSSDNGAAQYKYGNNYPLRGGKGTFFDGGVRVASFIVGGAVKLPKGSEVNALIHMADWYATFCAMAGVNPQDNKAGVPKIDSIDQSDVLSHVNAKAARTEVALAGVAYIKGDLKILKQVGKGNQHGYWTPKEWPTNNMKPAELDKGCGTDDFCLFNLTKDPTETTDLSEDMPSELEEMINALEAITKTKFVSDYLDPKESHCIGLQSFVGANSGFVGPICSDPKLKSATLQKISRIRR